MLRLIVMFLLFTACGHGVISSGGRKPYLYDLNTHYQAEHLKQLAPEMVLTMRRDPPVGKLDELFMAKKGPLKKIGILVFESLVQPTRGGLTGVDQIYLTPAGKQLLTEGMLSVWEEALPLLGPELIYLPVRDLVNSASYRRYGLEGSDHVKTGRQLLGPEDIAYQERGTQATLVTLLNPRGMRDFSQLAVPAAELMMGPKFSEHQKHLVNELTQELGLDAVLVVLSEVSWTAGQLKKRTQEWTSEEIQLALNATLLVPYRDYHRRLGHGGGEPPKVNLSFRSYQTQLRLPVNLTPPGEDKNFLTIQSHLLNPLLKGYNDLTQMMLVRIVDDLRTTH
jgi:hypothetical protein